MLRNTVEARIPISIMAIMVARVIRTKLNDASEDKKFKIITDTFNNIDKTIKNWILNEKY